MKLAKASQEEIARLLRWLQQADKNIVAPPPYMRVIFGYEMLVLNCCDPTKDTLEWRPGYAPEDTDRLRAGIKEALMHLDTNFDIEGRSMKDSDAANILRKAIAPC